MNSLRSRLLISTAIVLTFFLALTLFALDNAFQKSALVGEKFRLQTYIYQLLRVAQEHVSNQTLIFSGLENDSEFAHPGSGLYATVTSGDGQHIWSSASALGRDIPTQRNIQASQQVFERVDDTEIGNLFILSLGVIWVNELEEEKHYIFSVAHSTDLFNRQVGEFRNGIGLWLLISVILLAIIQGGILHWGLSPMSQLAHNVREIEMGHQSTLQGHYPLELKGVVNNLNTLIEHERRRQTRYRNAMADLAHSLKTPLAVLRNAVEVTQLSEQFQSTILEQIEHLDHITRYQLQRAVTSGKSTFSKPVNVKVLVHKVAGALKKGYSQKPVVMVDDVAENSVFYGEEGDFLEIIGNLLDNAYKYCRQQVSISAVLTYNDKDEILGLSITICDDGPGIAPSQISRVLKRGERADTQQAGHGIGLAVVDEIVLAYGGTLNISRDSQLGGTCIQVFLPK